jgi:hypothetical protein
MLSRIFPVPAEMHENNNLGTSRQSKSGTQLAQRIAEKASKTALFD